MKKANQNPGNNSKVTIEDVEEDLQMPPLEPNIVEVDDNEIIKDVEKKQTVSLASRSYSLASQLEQLRSNIQTEEPVVSLVSRIPKKDSQNSGVDILVVPPAPSNSYNEIMEKITNFETYLVDNYSSQKDKEINEKFIKKAKEICSQWEENSTLSEFDPSAFKAVVCEEIAKEAQSHFHHRHDIIRALADLVFIPLGIITGGLLFFAKAAMTNSYTFFLDKKTNRQEELEKHLYSDLQPQ